jgi:diguanylate cyclase (GGDEF)-like protein
MALTAIAFVVTALSPAVGLWFSWPSRRWAATAGAAASVIAWGVGAVLIEPRLTSLWLVSGAVLASAGLYVRFMIGRDASDTAQLSARLKKREGDRATVLGNLKAAKERSRDIEVEQREVLALYGMVKGLSEAMTWADLRPKLEVAVQQYLRVDAFAIYVVSGGAEDALRPLVRRRLGNGLGSSWDSVARHLQERAVSITVPHIVDHPLPAVALPVFQGQKLMGYFYAHVPQGREAELLLAKAQSFVDEISFAFQRIGLFQEVEKRSRIDGLTGVFRRGVFDEKLDEEILRAQAFKTTFCVMILDIDKFKNLNDSYGHPFGDTVLSRVGEILRESVYETDVVARYGGEEFSILLPRAEPEGVLRKAEVIRAAIEAETFELALKRIQVTVSIGVAHYPRDANTVQAIVKLADQALYHAKESGRNRVVDIEELRKAK